MTQKEKLLEVKDLKTVFHTIRGRITAVDGVSFEVGGGEILGIVGESGCGKSVTSQSILRLYDEKKQVTYTGQINFKNTNLLELSERDMQSIRGNEIAMIFQDALSSLNPVFTIGEQIVEAIRVHNKGIKKKQAMERAVQLLELTGIPAPEERVHAYPHEMSGGMRQRAMIAMALACEPKLLIADEPTTALDVTIQAQIMELICELHDRLGMGVILITHDLGVVSQVCTRVVVMYLGQIIENGPVQDIFQRPLHPYTAGLIASIPTLETEKRKKLYMIKGSVPAMDKAAKGCRFYDRCERAMDRCQECPPPLVESENGHCAYCWNPNLEGATSLRERRAL